MNSLKQLRLRLTLINAAVLIGLLVMCTIFLFVFLNINQASETGRAMEVSCSQIAGNMRYFESGDKSGDEWDDIRVNIKTFIDGLKSNDEAYIIWNDQFAVADKMEQNRVAEGELSNIVRRYFAERRTGAWITDYRYSNQISKVCTYPVVNKNGELRVVQIVKSMDEESNAVDTVLRMLALIVIFGGMLSVGIGYVLSGHSLKPVEESMERQQEFLANASHELRTPIAVIRTNLDVVRNDGEMTDDERNQWLGNAYEESKRMQQIVEDLMFLARADAGEAPFTPQKVDAGFICQEVAERMLPVAAQKDIIILWDLPDESLTVMGDEALLTQLLVIFVDNAIKYSDRHTTVRMKGSLIDKNVVIEVADEGIGIDKADIDKIFGRFYRVDKVRSRSQGGTGLGLSIAKWIVDIHGGQVNAQSELGKGTVMRVTLPAAEDRQ